MEKPLQNASGSQVASSIASVGGFTFDGSKTIEKSLKEYKEISYR